MQQLTLTGSTYLGLPVAAVCLSDVRLDQLSMGHISVMCSDCDFDQHIKGVGASQCDRFASLDMPAGRSRRFQGRSTPR